VRREQINLSFVITSHLPVASASVKSASVKSPTMESAKGMAEMVRCESMPDEVVPAIIVVVVNPSDHKITTVEPSTRIVRAEATKVRAFKRTKISVTGASAEQKDCRCGH
jgi:hypothetical protein